MSIRDYLHEKAEESRHNETLAYLMFIAGVISFIGGVLETLSITDNPSWFFFFPYHVSLHPASVLGLFFIFTGLALSIFGIVMGIHYARDRTWYMKELCKAHSIESSITLARRRERHKTKRSR